MGRMSIEKLRKKERTNFSRALELGAGPLAKRLNKLFAKIARRHIRELKNTGQLNMKPVPGAVNKAFLDDELDEMVRLLKIYASRRAKTSARRAGNMVGAKFALDTELVEEFLAGKELFVAGFGEAVSANIAKQTREVLLQVAREGGASTGEIARRLFNKVTGEGGALSPGRALGIARTEMAQIDNFAKNEAFAATGIQEVEWLTITDGREREDHAAMDGVRTPVGVPFQLPDGTLMMHPADESMGAGPEQIINCRCTTVPV